MGKSIKSIEEMYKSLLEDVPFNEDDQTIADYLSDDEAETFTTSYEIAKNRERIEERMAKKNANTTLYDDEVEVVGHFKRYTKRREHKYTETELKNIRESCKLTIVHDYGEHDIYHQSDEERRDNDMLAEIRMKLGSVHRTYRKVNEYIEAMRTVVHAWEIFEKQNYLHTKEEFFEMVANGQISSGIIMPKLKKMNLYNIDLIIKYISNPELDPMDLVPETFKSKDSFYDQFEEEENDEVFQLYKEEYISNHKDDEKYHPESPQFDEWGVAIDPEEELEEDAENYARDRKDEDDMARLLSPEEVQFVLDHEDDPPYLTIQDMPRKYIKGYERRGLNGRSKKKGNKKERFLREHLHDMLNKIESNPENRNSEELEYNRSYLVTNNMFDTPKPEPDFWENLRFDGSWLNENDLLLYDIAVREELLKLHPAKDKWLTYADLELDKFFKILEENGMNVVELRRLMNMDEEGTNKEEAKRTKKENKKKESAILQRITKLNNDPKFKKLVKKAEDELNKHYIETS